MSRPFDLKAFLVSQLRRASYKWPERTKVLQAARIERGLYKCATCLQIFDDRLLPVSSPPLQASRPPKQTNLQSNKFLRFRQAPPSRPQDICFA
jgi:hypothetical protein